MRRRFWMTGTVALAAAALILFGWLFTREARQPPTPLPSAVPTEAERLIAFESTHDGNAEIYVMDANGPQPKNITHHPAEDFSPEWSPDGRRLAFISDRTGKTEMYVMAADGTDLQQLTDDAEANWGGVRVEGHWLQAQGRGNLSWSPDVTRLAVTRVLINPTDDGWNESQIYAVNTDGSGSALLTDGKVRSNDFSPFWAPDGNRLAFLRQQFSTLSLVVEGPPDSESAIIRAQYLNYPAWSPKGDRLAYVVSVGELGGAQSEIWMAEADGSNATRLFNAEDRLFIDGMSLVWSPDGGRLAFAAWTLIVDRYTSQLFLIWSDGSGLIAVTDPKLLSYAPAWSPDSQWLAFMAQDGNASDIYAVRISDAFNSPAGLTAVRLTTTGQEQNPKWQP